MKLVAVVLIACLASVAFADHLCENDVCQNGATCHETNSAVPGSPNSFSCTCPPGYSGSLCERTIRTCQDEGQTYCQNGATCRDKQEDSLGDRFTCICAGNWTGPYCQFDGNYRACDTNPCQNGGTCNPATGGTAWTGPAFTCTCPTGKTGTLCQLETGQCSSNPCQNGGNCVSTTASGGFICQCPWGWEGSLCQTHWEDAAGTNNTNRGCQVYGCTNGNCDIWASLTGSSSGNMGVCANCPTSYPQKMGRMCEKNSWSPCLSNPCQNWGTCVNTGDQDYYCRCSLGFYGKNCESYVNQCNRNSSACDNDGSCYMSNWVGGTTGFANERAHWRTTCSCKPGWTGESCDVPDTCANRGCRNGGTCRTDVHSVGYGIPTCICPSGTTGTYCETQTSNFHPCETNPCQNGGKCYAGYSATSGEGSGLSAQCRCLPGFRGNRCQFQAVTEASGLQNFCSGTNPCQNGATCVNDPANQKYTCLCTPRFLGVDCQLAGAYFRTASVATVFALIALVVLFL